MKHTDPNIRVVYTLDARDKVEVRDLADLKDKVDAYETLYGPAVVFVSGSWTYGPDLATSSLHLNSANPVRKIGRKYLHISGTRGSDFGPDETIRVTLRDVSEYDGRETGGAEYIEIRRAKEHPFRTQR